MERLNSDLGSSLAPKCQSEKMREIENSEFSNNKYIQINYTI